MVAPLVPMTTAEILALPPTVPVRTAGRAFGISENLAYKLAAEDRFPCALIDVGDRKMAPRTAILAKLGISEDMDELSRQIAAELKQAS